MLKNERGSVLGIALIVLTILTFTISTTSVYTYNVASRTNELVQQRSNDTQARSILDQALYELKDYITNTLSPEDFTDQTTLATIANFVTDLEDWYGFEDGGQSYGIRIGDPISTNTEYDGEGNIIQSSATFRVRYDKMDGTTIYRDLFVSTETENTPPDPQTALNDLILGVKESEDTEVVDPENFDDQETGIKDGHVYTLQGDTWVQGDLDVEFQRREGVINLNDNIFLVDGNLDFENLTQFVGPGVLIITGDFIFDVWFDLEFSIDDSIVDPQFENNVLVIVQGNTVMNLTKPGRGDQYLTATPGTNFAWLTLKSHPDEDVHSHGAIASEGDTYHLSEEDEFVYMGNAMFSVYGSWENLFKAFGITYPPGYSFSEGSFNELEGEE